MDFDPLQDYPAPRYAVESDDSEDEHFMPGKAAPVSSPAVTVQFSKPPRLPTSNSLVVLVGSAGQQWLNYVAPVPTLQAISCNGIEVGAIDFSSYKDTTLVTVTHDLPSPYAVALAEELLTSRFAAIHIIDTYAGPSYISSVPFNALDLPVRYLQTTAAAKSTSLRHLPSQLLPFAPPNLVQGLAASLISRLESPSSVPPTPGCLILLPSRRIHPPPWKEPRHIPPSFLQEEWSVDVLSLIAEAVGNALPWSAETIQQGKKDESRSRKTSVGDEGMYI